MLIVCILFLCIIYKKKIFLIINFNIDGNKDIINCVNLNVKLLWKKNYFNKMK